MKKITALLALGLVFGLGWFGWRVATAQETDTATPAPARAWIAARPLPRGTIITEDLFVGADPAFVQVDYNAPEIASLLVEDYTVAVGRVLRVDMVTRAALLQNMVVDDRSATASIGSDTALFLPAGHVGVAMRQPLPEGLSYGDCVRLEALFNFGEGLETPLLITESGVVADTGEAWVAGIGEMEAALTLVWALDHNLPIITTPSTACPTG